jgi:hypothetical protein
MDSPETLSAGHEPETLSAGPEPDRHRSPLRVSRTVAAGACLVVAAVAGVGWAGGRWQSERQASERASQQVAVEFVLETVELNQVDNQALPYTWAADVTGVLVNSGPSPIVVQRLAWGDALASGPYALGRQVASPPLLLRTTVDCRPGQQTRVPMPAASIRVVTAANQVNDQPPVIPNVDRWDEAVARSCLSQSAPSPEDSLAVESVRYVPSGSVLTVLVGIRNGGVVAAESLPTFEAEGFTAVATPLFVTVAPGQLVEVTLHVTVADCRLARTGAITGITVAPNNDTGDNDLVRQLDRLATRTCAKK